MSKNKSIFSPTLTVSSSMDGQTRSLYLTFIPPIPKNPKILLLQHSLSLILNPFPRLYFSPSLYLFLPLPLSLAYMCCQHAGEAAGGW